MFCNILCMLYVSLFIRQFYTYIYIYMTLWFWDDWVRSGSKVCTSNGRILKKRAAWRNGVMSSGHFPLRMVGILANEEHERKIGIGCLRVSDYVSNTVGMVASINFNQHGGINVLNGSTVLYSMRCSVFEGLVTLKISLDSEFPFWPLYVLLRWPIIKRLWAVCPCLPHPNSSWDRWTRNEWEVFIVSTSWWGIVTCQGIHIAPRSKRFRGYLGGQTIEICQKRYFMAHQFSFWLFMHIWKANWKICGNDGQWWTFDCFEPTALWLQVWRSFEWCQYNLALSAWHDLLICQEHAKELAELLQPRPECWGFERHFDI